jgi:hypothetical protein
VITTAKQRVAAAQDLLAAIEEMEGRIPSNFNHLQFRFIVGPPSRYVAPGAPWMLDPTIAGRLV